MDTLPSVAGGRGFGASGDERKTRACIATTPALTGRGPSRDTVRSTGRGSPADRLLETKRIADEDPHDRFRPLWGGARLDAPGGTRDPGRKSPSSIVTSLSSSPPRFRGTSPAPDRQAGPPTPGLAPPGDPTGIAVGRPGAASFRKGAVIPKMADR